MSTDGIQKVPVVGYNQNRILIICEVFFQPPYCVQVKIVCGFIQQEIIGLSKKCLGQQHPYLLLSTEIFHHRIVQGLLDSQVTQQGGRITFGIPSIHICKFLFQL